MKPKGLPFTQIPLGLTISGGLIRRIFGFLLVLLGSSSYDLVLAQSPGTFTSTGNMTTARSFHTATLLTNGNVLIAGGASSTVSPHVPVASAELYDPSDGTFVHAGNMTTARSRHTATLLPDGKVLIVGGSPLRSAELYDPLTGTFTATGDTIAARPSNTATLLNNGKVLITGGPRAELYDPATGFFAATG